MKASIKAPDSKMASNSCDVREMIEGRKELFLVNRLGRLKRYPIHSHGSARSHSANSTSVLVAFRHALSGLGAGRPWLQAGESSPLTEKHSRFNPKRGQAKPIGTNFNARGAFILYAAWRRKYALLQRQLLEHNLTVGWLALKLLLFFWLPDFKNIREVLFNA